jgi:hypothetical protein
MWQWEILSMVRGTATIIFALVFVRLMSALRSAHAEEKFDVSWWTDCRHGWITKEFPAELMRGVTRR